jgi:hypothetical protein
LTLTYGGEPASHQKDIWLKAFVDERAAAQFTRSSIELTYSEFDGDPSNHSSGSLIE